MRLFVDPEITVQKFEIEEIILTSGSDCVSHCENELPM